MAGRQGWNLRKDNPSRVVLSGPNNPNWKGDAARPGTKRNRARRLYKLGTCDRCGASATDRHHVDGDTGNNERSNVMLLCRRCHMEEDGRLSKFISTSRSLLGPQPPKACSNCHREAKPLRRGRCSACAEYLRRTGNERPATFSQRCHNRYDLKHRAETRAEIKKGLSVADVKLMNKLAGWQLQMKLTEQEPDDG